MPNTRRLIAAACALGLILSATLADTAFSSELTSSARHRRRVVVIVWDGMRPDFVSEQLTPALFGLARQGVSFAHHHSVYLSSTEVNGATLSTGAYPEHDGIMGNNEYRADLDPLKPIHTENQATIRQSDELTRGKHVRLPTLAEIVRRNGKKAVVAGAKPVVLLADRVPRASVAEGANIFAGSTLPSELEASLKQLHGEFPKEAATNRTRNDWTTDALVISLWSQNVPDFSFLWLNQPDFTQHTTGPGSPQTLAAIRNADDNLAKVLRALEIKGLRETTDVIVVSDHGCSTVSERVDLAEALRKNGFVVSREFKTRPARGDIMIVSNGGSSLLYVVGRDEKIIGALVRFLQSWEHTGVIFTRKALPGTFAQELAHVNTPDAPDIVVSMRWTAERNKHGAPGMVTGEVSSFEEGQGLHVSLSPFDMHGILFAAGPDFRAGIVSVLPSGNVDVAPTVLWLLGIKPSRAMDGRVLTEALTGKGPPIKSFEPQRLETTQAQDGIVWRQYLNFTEVNGVIYLDEGNGSQSRK